MKNVVNKLKALWKDESAQGMTEYILLVVVVISLVMIFKKPIIQAVTGKVGELSGEIGNFKVEGGG